MRLSQRASNWNTGARVTLLWGVRVFILYDIHDMVCRAFKVAMNTIILKRKFFYLLMIYTRPLLIHLNSLYDASYRATKYTLMCCDNEAPLILNAALIIPHRIITLYSQTLNYSKDMSKHLRRRRRSVSTSIIKHTERHNIIIITFSCFAIKKKCVFYSRLVHIWWGIKRVYVRTYIISKWI